MVNPFKAAVAAGKKLVKPAVMAARKIKTNRPEIYVVGGVLMILTSFGLAVYEATKIPEAMARGNEKLDALKDRQSELMNTEKDIKVPVSVHDEDGNEIYVNQYRIMSSEERAIQVAQINKDIYYAKIDGIWQVGKLMVWPLILLVIGLGFDLRGVHILRKENIALATTVGGLEKFIKFYRNNVIADQGKEKDLQYARGITGEVEVNHLNGVGPDGKEKIETEKIPVISHTDGNPWRFEYSPTFFRSATGNVDHDIHHILNVQNYFNHLYGGRKKHGKISYYEVLEYLDPIWEALDATGSVEIFTREYGWGHDKRGDDYIDLGVYRAINSNAITGNGDCVWIEGNCDGRLSDLKNQYKEKYLT